MAYSRFHPGKFSLWLDWETSGANFKLTYPEQAKIYQGVQLGLVIADNETFEEVAATKITIKFDPKYKWEDAAQKIHGLSREYLEENGVTREEAAIAVIEFMLEHFNKDVLFMLADGPVDRNSHRVCFGGHNLEFDIAHFKELLAEVGFGVDEHHVKLNTTVIGFHGTGLYKSDDLFQLFGAEKRGAHDALDDTRQALAVARGIKSLITAGLEATA
jgi:hypothetical protein